MCINVCTSEGGVLHTFPQGSPWNVDESVARDAVPWYTYQSKPPLSERYNVDRRGGAVGWDFDGFPSVIRWPGQLKTDCAGSDGRRGKRRHFHALSSHSPADGQNEKTLSDFCRRHTRRAPENPDGGGASPAINRIPHYGGFGRLTIDAR